MGFLKLGFGFPNFVNFWPISQSQLGKREKRVFLSHVPLGRDFFMYWIFSAEKLCIIAGQESLWSTGKPSLIMVGGGEL